MLLERGLKRGWNGARIWGLNGAGKWPKTVLERGWNLGLNSAGTCLEFDRERCKNVAQTVLECGLERSWKMAQTVLEHATHFPMASSSSSFKCSRAKGISFHLNWNSYLIQSVSELEAQFSEKSFELEVKAGDNRVLQEQLNQKDTKRTSILHLEPSSGVDNMILCAVLLFSHDV
ncbi:hypothetical protein L6452_23756 [Arctium lappa]|uniref:Uncharacterized protein n=1 Tax=Arctium lappa TaxID=4217 RepID=A0ACB9A7T1_ARCLA|nr:hypothetical protein L6452_23756 [Arctium lappa]